MSRPITRSAGPRAGSRRKRPCPSLAPLVALLRRQIGRRQQSLAAPTKYRLGTALSGIRPTELLHPSLKISNARTYEHRNHGAFDRPSNNNFEDPFENCIERKRSCGSPIGQCRELKFTCQDFHSPFRLTPAHPCRLFVREDRMTLESLTDCVCLHITQRCAPTAVTFKCRNRCQARLPFRDRLDISDYVPHAIDRRVDLDSCSESFQCHRFTPEYSDSVGHMPHR
ncbi:hypothetical protein APR12_006805 [Nocardia amikacinitolerans]|nr:hypothetical protein [Nocardia amikacinitolerans]